MGQAWPYLRRFWALLGAVLVGLAVTWLYSLLSGQPLPHLRIAAKLLQDDWHWMAGLLTVLGALSVVAEQAHRRREARAPKPLPTQDSAIRRVLGKFSRPVRARASETETRSTPPPMVGRATELARLNDWFTQVEAGSRRVIFVSGEPGIGKTTLTRAFLDSISRDGTVRIGRGQCVEQYGAGEPYMPVLEALTRLCREPGSERLVEILHRLAPAWLAQMPTLVSAEDRLRLQGQTQGTTQQRMLREMAEALEVIAADSPLVLMLEDLHWSDPSTIDLIATIARRSESARLLILGTYRPVEILAKDHPLRRLSAELELHGHCNELRLPLLSEVDIATYLAMRFADGGMGEFLCSADSAEITSKRKSLNEVAPVIYSRTEGNPLFMVNVVDYLLKHGPTADLNRLETPNGILQMIERNIDRLTSDEQAILQAASVVGPEFSSAAVAAAHECATALVEETLASLARREQFVASTAAKRWPDGTVAASFRFLHALYKDALYERVPVGSRTELHGRIAKREEAGYGQRANEIATELAHHYREANDVQRAINFLRLAADQAASRSALAEAEAQLRDAVALVPALPNASDRDPVELRLQTILGGVLLGRSFGLQEREEVMQRALELCHRVSDTRESLPAFFQVVQFYIQRARLTEARELAAQALEIGRKSSDPLHAAGAWYNAAETSFWSGDLFTCLTHAERAFSILQDVPATLQIETYGFDLTITAAILGSIAELLFGKPERSAFWERHFRSRTDASSHPFTKALGTVFGKIFLDQIRDDWEEVDALVRWTIPFSQEFGFHEISGWAGVFGGWASSWSENRAIGIAKMREAKGELDKLGSLLISTWWLALVAKAETDLGDYHKAAGSIAKAFESLERTGERWCEPEVHRIAGELQRHRPGDGLVMAEVQLREAITIAQKMEAKWWELRATASLARLLLETGRRDEARTTLAEIYGWFAEGFDTRDLKDAKALLDELR